MRRLTVILLLLLTSLGALRAQLNTNRIMQIGRNALYFEDYVLSIQYFNRVINVKPYLSDPYYYRAIAKFYLDDLQGSAGDCEVALGINPFHLGAYNLRGIVRLRQGRSRDALEDFQAGLRLEPDNINLMMNEGIAHINLGNYDDAIATYDRLLGYDRRNVSAILYRGIAIVNNGDSIEALGEFIRATEINSYSANAYTYRGMLHYQLRMYQEALADYNRLAELRPMDAYVRVNRAITRYNLDDLRGCLEDLDEAVRLDPRNTLALANRGILRAEVGDYNNAIDDFTKVLTLNPSDDIALFNRAMLYIQTGQASNALTDLNVIIAKHPDFGPAYYQRAGVRQTLGDNDGADADYLTAYTFEQERIKRGLAAGQSDQDNDDQSDETETDNHPRKRSSRGRNDNDIRKWDQMVVVSDFGDNDDKLREETPIIRGRVQDRDISIDLEPVFELSFYPADTLLQRPRYYQQSVSTFNTTNLFTKPLVITNREYTADNTTTVECFEHIANTTQRIEQEPLNYQLYMVRGTLSNMVMNYNDAINDFNVCLLKQPDNINALFNRAATRFKMVEVIRSLDTDNPGATPDINLGNTPTTPSVQKSVSILDYDLIASDLQQVLNLAPTFEFAYYNLSLVQCARRQFDEALASLDKAIELNTDFAEAYFNRGILKIYQGDTDNGTADLSKAGELGMFKAYNVIKRYTTTPDDIQESR